MSVNSPSFTLRELPFPARLTLAVFLISVGVGYVAAMIQLHFQDAKPGTLLPTVEDAKKKFSRGTEDAPKAHMLVLVAADEGLPWNGTGQMSAAFTTRSDGWKGAIKKQAKKMGKKDPTEGELAEAEKALRAQRDTERLGLMAWLDSGANKREYDADKFILPKDLADRPLTEGFEIKDGETRGLKIKSVIENRCVRCHSEGGDPKAEKFPMANWKELKPFVTAKTGATAMSLNKLAQTSHVHLLGFAVLYGLTGLIFSFSSYPSFLRTLIAPAPLLFQVIDISFWWLARLDAPIGPQIAAAIPITGGIVAAALILQIVLGLFALFGRFGKVVLVLLFAGAIATGYVAKTKVIDPYLAREHSSAQTAE